MPWCHLWFVFIWACVSIGILETGGGNTQSWLIYVSSALHFMSEHLVPDLQRQTSVSVSSADIWLAVVWDSCCLCYLTVSLSTQFSLLSHGVVHSSRSQHGNDMKATHFLMLLRIRRLLHFRKILSFRFTFAFIVSPSVNPWIKA